MNYSIKVNQTVPLNLFDTGVIKEAYLNATSGMTIGILMKQRYDEIINFLNMKDNIDDNLSFKNISKLTKFHFFESVANEAVQIAFSDKNKTDVLENIKSLITIEKVKEAILGEAMITSFEDAISNMKKTANS